VKSPNSEPQPQGISYLERERKVEGGEKTKGNKKREKERQRKREKEKER